VGSRGLSNEEVEAFCRAHWASGPERIDFQGGTDRKTVLIHVAGNRYALSKRQSERRAALEALALEALAETGRVPHFVQRDGAYVVQQAVDGVRLTETLERSSPQERMVVLKEAGETLALFKTNFLETGFDTRFPQIACRPNWHRDFAASPIRLANALNMRRPSYSVETVSATISTRVESFCKWDARPGNALVSGGQSVWFDWEHCGFASAEDDYVWLFADEWSPICHAAEETCLRTVAELYAVPFDDMLLRFRMKALLHTTIRLALIFRRKGEGGWWDPVEAMQHDRVGVTRAHVRRLCQRGIIWAEQVAEMACFRAFFEEIEALSEQV